MNTEDAINRVWTEVGDVLTQGDAADVTALVDRLEQASHVFVAGQGRSGLIGKCFAMRIMHIGLSVYSVGEVVTPAIGPGALLVAISGSGSTPVTLTVAQRALAAGAKILLISSRRASPIARLAHHVLVLPAKAGESERASIQPMGSLFDQSTHLLLDAVCVLLVQRLGRTMGDLRSRHTNL